MNMAFKSMEEEVQTYSEEELLIWNKGYLSAIEGLLEQINGDQVRLLNRLLTFSEAGEERRSKHLLESRLVVLDAYEAHYKKRLAQLERDAR